MVDLNATLFFKGKFQVEMKQEDTDLLWELVMKIRLWMLNKWKRNGEEIPEEFSCWTAWKYGGSISSQNEIVHFRSVYHKNEDNLEFWACKIIESWPSQNGCAPREWTTEIGFEQKDNSSATISIVIYYSDRPGFIGPCEKAPDASVPKIIRLFVQDARMCCTTEGYPLDLKAHCLKPGAFPEFWKIVCNEEREIPVVYISPRRLDESPDQCETLLDPQRLADLLGPNALVYYADDLEFSREMSLLCRPAAFDCYAGGVRIYATHPRPAEEDDAFRHRYITARSIEETGEMVYAILRRALAQDVHFYEHMFRMEDCQRLNEKTRAEQNRKAYHASVEKVLLESAVEQERNLNQQLEEQRFAWEQEKEALEIKVSSLQEDLYQSRAREDAYRQAAVTSNARKQALDQVRKIDRYPDTPHDIAKYFVQHFPDRLDFTDRGWKSLNECEVDLAVFWDVLYQMVTTLYELYEDDSVKLVDQAFNSRSKFHLARGEGTMTRKDSGLMRQYTDVYQGKEISIEAHIKSSKVKESDSRFIRIYFCYDGDLHKLLIGSCGRHFENYTSQKIK